MADDLSPDVTTIADDDIADEPLFDSPVTAATVVEAPESTEADTETKGTETQEADKTDEASTEAADTEAIEPSDKDAQSTDEAPKGQPDPQLARQAYLQRQQTRQAVTQQITENYAPKSAEELYQENIDKGMDEQLAQYESRIQAMEEREAYNEQRANLAEMNAGMQADAVNVINDFPVFRQYMPGTEKYDNNGNIVDGMPNPEYDAEFTNMVESQYKQAARLEQDENGLVLNAEVPFYEFHKRMADIYNRGASRGSQQGQKEALETLSRTESVGSSSSTSRGPETLEEMGERLANMPLI